MHFTDERSAGRFAAYDIGSFYDGMFASSMQPRPHYWKLYEQLAATDHPDLARRQHAADSAFLRQGITFNVYQDEQGLERAIPVDLVPHIIDAREWSTIVVGLTATEYAGEIHAGR